PWGSSGGTVPASSGRAEVRSAKLALSRYGMYLGWSYMSLRQPASRAAIQAKGAAARRRRRRRPAWGGVGSVLNVGELAGVQALEEPPGLDGVEERVARLEAEEEPAPRRQREAGDVEDRVVRPGQAVEPE